MKTASSSSGGNGKILKDFKQNNGIKIYNWECHSESILPKEGIELRWRPAV